MPTVKFRVTEINDLSKDGAHTKRIVMEADNSVYIGTGAQADSRDPKAFGDKARVAGRFELLVDNATQAAYFPMDSIQSFEVSAPPTPSKADTSADKAKA